MKSLAPLFFIVLVACTYGPAASFRDSTTYVRVVDGEEFKIEVIQIEVNPLRFSTMTSVTAFFRWVGGDEGSKILANRSLKAARQVVKELCGDNFEPSVYRKQEFGDDAHVYVDFECSAIK